MNETGTRPAEGSVKATAILTSVIFLFLSTLKLAGDQPSAPGPFGFQSGMTKQQVVAMLGEDALKPKSIANWFWSAKAPKQHPLFDHYELLISPKAGVVKVLALSKVIPTSAYGEVLQEQFSKIRDQVAKTYGKYETYDYLNTGSIWKEPRDWMKGLEKEERTLVCFWRRETGAELKNTVFEVRLEANALDETHGALVLTFEFEKFKAYEEEQKKAFE